MRSGFSKEEAQRILLNGIKRQSRGAGLTGQGDYGTLLR